PPDRTLLTRVSKGPGRRSGRHPRIAVPVAARPVHSGHPRERGHGLALTASDARSTGSERCDGESPAANRAPAGVPPARFRAGASGAMVRGRGTMVAAGGAAHAGGAHRRDRAHSRGSRPSRRAAPRRGMGPLGRPALAVLVREPLRNAWTRPGTPPDRPRAAPHAA